MPSRTTCIYCEQEGVDTPLVPAHGRWACPIHSADFVKSGSFVPEGYALVKKPELLGVGVPTTRKDY